MLKRKIGEKVKKKKKHRFQNNVLVHNVTCRLHHSFREYVNLIS